MTNSEFEQILESIAVIEIEDARAIADLEEYLDSLEPEMDTEE